MNDLELQAFIGSRIREARQARGYRQKELAKRLGLAKSTICRYEDGQRVMSVGLVIQIAKTLGCPLDFLIGNDQEREAFVSHKLPWQKEGEV